MRNLTIGIANNHQALREGFAELLTSLGHKVIIQAENGYELLDKLSTSPTLLKVCITDLHMPVMDGFALAKEIKERYYPIKVIAFSMSGRQEDIERVLQCGADRFVYKGDYEELQEVLLSFS